MKAVSAVTYIAHAATAAVMWLGDRHPRIGAALVIGATILASHLRPLPWFGS